MKKVYISGQITGIEVEAKRLFKEAESKLIKLGYDVVNPSKLTHDHDLSWVNYMKIDIKAMMDCDAIYFLKNWSKSKGARIEREIAISLNYEMMYEE